MYLFLIRTSIAQYATLAWLCRLSFEEEKLALEWALCTVTSTKWSKENWNNLINIIDLGIQFGDDKLRNETSLLLCV